MDSCLPDGEESIAQSPLDIMYPLPSTGTPLLLRPVSEGSASRTLLRVLRHNHEHHHAYIKSKWFEKYAPRRASDARIYGLGASAQHIERAYQAHDDLTPAYESPEPITDVNSFYAAYVAYFSRYLMDHSPWRHSNASSSPHSSTTGKSAKRPAMLSRLFSGLLHPFIHAAYGIEFGIPGQLAEGMYVSSLRLLFSVRFRWCEGRERNSSFR
ncbi:hypothetical protein BC826DRAFT_1050740 [Russula brevipes]|nr:hypothetical protein BC826DRAFT_1050740 [Russula brevipes]